MRRLIKFLIIMAFLSAVLYLAWTGTPMKGYVKGKLEAAFVEKTGLKVSIGKISWQPPLTLQCEDIHIERTDGAAVTVEKVKLRPSVRELLHGSIALRKLYLHNVTIDLPKGATATAPLNTTPLISPAGIFVCPIEISDIYLDGLTIRGENVPSFAEDLKKLVIHGSVDCDMQNKSWTSMFKIKNRDSTNLLAMATVAVSLNYQEEDYSVSILFDEKNGGVLLHWLEIEHMDALALKVLLKGKLSDGLLLPTQCKADLACEGELEGDWQSLTRINVNKEDIWRADLKNQFTGSLQGGQTGDFIFDPGKQTLQGTLTGNIFTPQWGEIDLFSHAAGKLSNLKGKIQLSAPLIRSTAEIDLEYNDKLQLPKVYVDWDGTKIDGKLVATISPIMVQGDLTVQDLPLDFFMPVSGQLNGSIHLTEKGQEQNVQIRLNTENLKHEDLFIKELNLQGSLDDLFGKAQGSVQLSADEMTWKNQPLGDLQIDTFHNQKQEWPFKLTLANPDKDLHWNIQASGHWQANKKKQSLFLKEFNGTIQDYKTTLTQIFEAKYAEGLLTASPIKLKVDESTLYAALNEKGNSKELTTHFLNVPTDLLSKLLSRPIENPSNISWNFKGHLNWQDDFEKAHLKLTASNKDAGYATTLLTSLKSSAKHHMTCKWDLIHPENGVLRLFSEDLRLMKIQSKGECSFNSPNILTLIEKGIVPEFKGNTTIQYQLPQDSGQLFTHFQYNDDLVRLQGVDIKGDLLIAKGSIGYDMTTHQLSGDLKGGLRDHSLNAQLELSGELLSPLLKLTAKYISEQDKEPILIEADGQLANNILKGQGKASTVISKDNLMAEAAYTIHLDEQLSTKIKATTSFADKTKGATQFGKLKAQINLEGPLKSLKGEILVNGSDLKIDGNKLPLWTARSQIEFPVTGFPFQLQFENNNFMEGSVALDSGRYTLSINKMEALYEKVPITLSNPWTAHWLEDHFDSSLLKVKLGDGLLQLQAKGNLENFDFDIQGNSLPAMLPIFSTPFPFTGVVNLKGHLSGPLSAPQGTMQIDVDNLHFEDKFFGNAPYCKAKFAANITSGKAHFKGEMLCPGIEPVTLYADLPVNLSFYPFEASLSENSTLEIALKASGALGPILDIFIPHVNAVTGYLNLTLNVKGTSTKPIISGIIALEKGSYENLETGTFLKDITIKARAEDSSITIEELYASDGKDGALNGKGRLTIDPKQGFPFELNCKLEKMFLLQKDFVRSAFNGNILFKGDKESAVVSGEILGVSSVFYIPEEIPEGADTVDVTFVNIPEEKQKRTTYEKPAPKAEYPITLDLDFKTNNKLRIRGRGLESTWKGQAHISGPLSSPNVQGEVKIIDGTYDFKGRIFELREGTISFAGPWDTKTTLYVIGSLEIDDTLIEALLRGPLKNPTLAFRSNPAMAQREIVSYLLFGKGPSEITPYQGNQLSRSISNLNKVGGDSPDLLTNVRNRLRLDRIDINREITSAGDKVSVQVGKYICKGVYVSLNKSITDDGNSIAVDARVINHVRARAQITDNAETQLLLKWRKDF
ncbi:MAG: translocation/assembly module TamB domain-containing protein [Parachlamydiales bacterium]|jgi:hypothetical protein